MEKKKQIQIKVSWDSEISEADEDAIALLLFTWWKREYEQREQYYLQEERKISDSQYRQSR